MFQVGIILMSGKDKNPNVRMARQDLARGFQSVEVRHGDVHQHDIRLEFLCHPDRIATCLRLTADRDVAFRFKQETQTFPYDLMILGQKHLYEFHTFQNFSVLTRSISV